MMVTPVLQFGKPAVQPTATATLYSSEHLHIQCHNPQADRAVVVFDHRRPRTGDFAVIKPSRKIIEAGFSYITVASKRNDWFLSPSLADCQATVSEFMARYDRVVGFGSSMGGYGVLALSRAFRFKQVLLVSPQITVFPDKPPFDPRFAKFAADLERRFDVADQSPRKGLGGVVLFDPLQAHDRAHADRITTLFPRLKRVPMSFAGHPALKLITQNGAFHRIQDELIAQRISAHRLRQLHRTVGRETPEYQSALAAFQNRRSQ